MTAIRVQHQPAMPWREVPEFVKANVNVEQHYDVTRAILLFVILTACRSGEARGVILPFLMDRISRIKYSSMVAYRRWLDEAVHGCRTRANEWHSLQHRSNF